MANKRITQLPTAPQVEDNDYIALDNTSTPTAENEGGTRKILAKDVMAKSADAVEYDNTSSGLEADNVQDAIDEVLEEGGKVQDVKVNGVSVLDNNKTAQIVSYKEVTQAQYDALPSSKLTDGIMYCIKDAEFSAEDVPYDNSDSGLESEKVQSAVDEIADVLGALKVEGTVENAQIATFTDGSALPMPKLEVAIEPIQEGSGDPSPTNIRPISGRTEANVVNMDDITNKAYFDGLMNGTYGYVNLGSLNWTNMGTSDKGFYTDAMTIKSGECLCAKYIFVDGSSIYSGDAPDKSIGLTGSNNSYRIRIKDTSYTADISGANNLKTSLNGVHLVYELATPTTPTITPTEFNNLLAEFDIDGCLYIIDLNGTRYGVKLDVVSGVLTVEKASIKLSDLIWTKQNTTNNNWRFKSSQSIQNIKIPTSAAYKIDNLCSVYRNVTANETWTADDTGIAINADGSLFICDLNQANTTALGVVIANQTYCYELATPTTIQLTPTQVNSLMGVNNISANSGKINKAVYIRDLNIVINNLLNG